MDGIAQELDQVRREFAHLLSAYTSAPPEAKKDILNQCEHLGGEVQELVGVLKLAIRNVIDASRPPTGDESPDVEHLEQIANHGLRVAHCAGEEVSAAVRLIRQLREKQSTSEP